MNYNFNIQTENSDDVWKYVCGPTFSFQVLLKLPKSRSAHLMPSAGLGTNGVKTYTKIYVGFARSSIRL
jgi:hypothetical protein